MTRIRYDKKSNPEKWSANFNVGGTFYTLYLYTKILKYEVISVVNTENHLIVSDSANNLQTVMRKAKIALKELGVKFDDEIRENGRNEKLVFDAKIQTNL